MARPLEKNQSPLPLDPDAGIGQRWVDCPEVGLSFHILEAGGTPDNSRPLLLLLHGFPEMGYCWRKVIPGLEAAGYYVVAPDLRGAGRTTGWDTSSFEEVDVNSFSLFRLVGDLVALISALGSSSVHAVIGHDFGSPVASSCTLLRPDLFRSLVMMSHPFNGTPYLAFDKHQERKSTAPKTAALEDLAKLPEPRKHYKWYYSTAPAAKEMLEPIEDLHPFLRAYYHTKSADWPQNNPHPLEAWSAVELAKMPYYYIMPLHESMREAVARDMPSKEVVDTQSSKWLPDSELDVYVSEWRRTGFQGALNWYRYGTSASASKDTMFLANRKIDVPATFITGAQDWGNYQEPGALDRCAQFCSTFKGVKFIENAGHWVQQEQPKAVVTEVLSFLKSL